MAATGLGLIGYTHAKERLIAQGMDRERVEKMAVGQVIAIYTERVYRRFSDDYEKLWYVPFADMNKASDSVEKRLQRRQSVRHGRRSRDPADRVAAAARRCRPPAAHKCDWNATWRRCG